MQVTVRDTEKLEDILSRIVPDEFYSQYTKEHNRQRDEVYALCPLHDEDTPSFHYNCKTGQFYCHGCHKSGHYIEFLAAYNKTDKAEAMSLIRSTYGGGNGHNTKLHAHREVIREVKEVKSKPKLPSIEQITKWQEALWNTPRLMDYLRNERGFTDDTIAVWQIGTNGTRYTLPIYDADGKLVSVRYYSPKPSNGKKWMNTAGCPTTLFPAQPADDERILLCEGEFDTILAIQNGYSAITGTGGCGTWKDEWSKQFAGKVVTIAYDNDDAGRSGAMLAAESLSKHAISVRILKWPDVYVDKFDITDFFARHKYSTETLDVFISQSRDYVNPKSLRMPRDVRGVLPDHGFISSYVGYATDLTDAPPEFHLAVGLSILAAATQNRVTFSAWGQDVCLNVWSVLVAPSGFYRKSTAINIGMRLLKSVLPDVALADDFTREALIAGLEQKPGCIMPVFEFGELLTKLSGDGYMRGTKELLTHLYDCPDEYTRKTVTSTNSKVTKPSLSILGASTIDWLTDRVSKGDMKGGFLARYLFWPAYQKLDWKGMTPPPNRLLQQHLEEWLLDVSRVEGAAVFDTKERNRYNEWVRSHEEEVNECALPDELQGFYTRMATYVAKLAVIYQLSFDKSIVVSSQALEQAIRTCEYLKSHLIKLVESDMVYTKDQRNMKDVLSVIKRTPNIDHSELLKRSRMMKRDLDNILDTLVESGQVVRAVESTGKRPKRTYKVNG